MTSAAPTITALPAEAEQLAAWLRDGKPELGWRGDPRLELRLGLATTKRGGYNKRLRRVVQPGEVIDWRYEVWRHGEDGRDHRLGSWPQNAFHHIINDLIEMDPRTPGHVPVEDRTDAAMAKAHKDAADRVREAHGQMAEHALAIYQERALGVRNQHFMNTPRTETSPRGFKVNDRRASTAA